MGDITQNLSRREFACGCGCGLADPHPILVYGIQVICYLSRCKEIAVTSGSRCDNYNDAVGGSEYSRHMPQDNGYTYAADIAPLDGKPIDDLLHAALSLKFFIDGGVGLYLDPDFLHVDVRGTRTRWGSIGGVGCSFGAAVQYLDQRKGG